MPPTSGSHIKYFPGLLCLSWPETTFGIFESTFSGDLAKNWQKKKKHRAIYPQMYLNYRKPFTFHRDLSLNQINELPDGVFTKMASLRYL